MAGGRLELKYRSFQIAQDLPRLLDDAYLAQGETLVVYAARESFSFSYEVPGREVRAKRSGEEGKPIVSVVVASPSPGGSAVQVGDALLGNTRGAILTNRRLVAFELVPADPSLKEPSLMDGFKDLGRTLIGKAELPPYPMACRALLELPATIATYQGIHKEAPKNCYKAKYHRISFADGSTLGLLA